ncbi:MAG: alpha/beta fold hydrolase [Ktedonobacterales bacterium]
MNPIAHTEKGRIEYRVMGQGPAVLVLNGGHTNCNSPLGHQQFFPEHGYQLIIPSRPGYGKTPSSTGRTAEVFADALLPFLDQLQLEQVIVLGISAAGRTALQFAGRHPERVSKIILQNALTGGKFPALSTRILAHVGFNPWVERWTWAAFRWIAKMAPRAALKAMMGSLTTLDPNVVLDTMSEEQRRAALAFLLPSRSASGFLHDLRHVCGDLSRITAPTLIIESKYDGSKDTSHAAYAADHIPNADLFVVPAESHLMWFSSYSRAIEERMRVFLLASQVSG